MNTSITATVRTEKGSRAVSQLRAKGVMPAVVYGGAEKGATMISLDVRDFEKAWREAGESTVVTLLGLGTEKSVLIQEVSVDPLKGTPVHADLLAVRTDQEVEVDVTLVFTGVAPAEKELGGTLVKVMHTLTISALPKNLPHELPVSIESLTTFDTHICVKDIPLPSGVSVDESQYDEVVALVQAAREEEPETAAPADVSAVEVEKKGKEEAAE